MIVPPLTLVLVRHGRTVYNVEHRLQGWSDSPLTDDGLAAVRATAAHLSGEPFTAAYASPSGRTVATANEILRHHPGTDLTTHPGLREFSFGDYEAMPEMDLFSQVNATEMFRGVFDGTFEGLPGGEPPAEYVSRVTEAFTAIETSHGAGERVLVVSHGVTLMAYLTMLGARPGHPLDNASVTTVEVAPDGTRTVTSVGVDPSAAAARETGEALAAAPEGLREGVERGATPSA